MLWEKIWLQSLRALNLIGSDKNLSVTAVFVLTPGIDTHSLIYDVAIPRTISKRQRIRKVELTPSPEYRFEEEGINFARFKFKRPTQPIEIRMTISASLCHCDFYTAKLTRTAKTQDLESDLSKWLISEPFIEKDATEIKEVARKLRSRDLEFTLQSMMGFVVQHVRQGPYDPRDRGALWALKAKTGDCSECADLFVALCRANSIPARVCEGYVLPLVPGETLKHAWAEAYLDDLGWVPFDPAYVRGGAATVDKLRSSYLYFRRQYNHKRPYKFANNLKQRIHYDWMSWHGAEPAHRESFRLNYLR